MSYENGYNNVMHAAGMQKTAWVGQTLKGLGNKFMQSGGGRIRDSFGALKELPEQFGNFRKGMAAAGRHAEKGNTALADTWRQGAMGEAGKYLGRLAPAAKVTGAGAAGLGAGAYAMGDADTTQNQMANFANNNLGTDFGTTSRFSNMFG